MKMPFGKYRGRELSEVPTTYLRWALEYAEGLTVPVRLAVSNQLEARESGNSLASPPAPTRADLLALVRKWHHRMKLAHHPELGGTAERMATADSGAELLTELVNELVPEKA